MYFCVCCVKEDGKEKDRFLTFDDEQFEDYCLEHFDADGDGVISEWEAAKVDTIFLSQRTIKSLETISNFFQSDLFAYWEMPRNTGIKSVPKSKIETS